MKVVLILSFFVLTACAVTVKTYQNPDQSFDDFETWCWLEGCEVTYQGPDYLYDKKVVDEIANAVAYNMYKKGYQQGDDQSDLMVNFFMVVEEDSAEVGGFYDGTYQGEREWLTMLYPEYQKFLKGSLVIDVIDRENSELVWRSNAVKYMELNPIYDKKEIWNGVTKAMKKLPEKE
ncbi:DUF4136 domain-containing protein [Ekhidna sp.]|jgi:hypothetical protein|uniref:DUF4136 domain-containing protein n=1 Tax=Ekhidna sp. TaxID=2608089 RepID=UPI0032EE0814